MHILVFQRTLFVVWLAISGLLVSTPAEAGTWTALTSGPPLGVNNCLLLTDGTVLAMNGAGQCERLTPDLHGSYINGKWNILTTMNDSRLFFASDVLTNGNVYVAGGEYGDANHYAAELYDTKANTWTIVPGSQAPNFGYSDSPSEMLPNGQLLVSDSQGTYNFYNVASNMMVHGGGCGDMNEVCWVKLASGAIFGVDNYGNGAVHYVYSANEWITDASSTPSGFQGGDDCCYLLPNGQVFHSGSVANTGFYTPAASVLSAGSLVNGPALPVVGTNQLYSGESPGAMLPDGNILLDLAPNGGGASGGGPCYFYEYNYVANTFTAVSAPGGGTSFNSTPFANSMLDLPDGTVLFVGGQNSGSLFIYTPTGTPLTQGQPVVQSITQNQDGSYHVIGTGLSGISEGAMYGDDEQMACNYPLVRLTNNATLNVYYARTFNWNCTTVQNTNPVTTEFSLPYGLPAGTYSLVVTTVGNPSAAILFTNNPPAAPTGLTGTTSNALAVLSWNAVSGATAYNVKRLTTVGTPYYATVATVTGTSCTNAGLVNAFTYNYVVTAVTPGGESLNSASVNLTPTGPPPVPVGVVAASATFARIYVSWTPSYGATSYNIERSTLHNGPYTLLATSPNPFYADTAPFIGETNYYVVSALSGEGVSSNSAVAGAMPQTIADYGFEIPSIGSGNYEYTPGGSPWAFSGTNGNGAGLIANGSGFSNPNAPEGVQAAFVQSNGVISQILSGFTPGTSYGFTFYAAQRPGGSQHGGESWNVMIDSNIIGSFNPGGGATTYVNYTARFTATAATHTLSFVGTDLATGDNTVFIDDVRITPALLPVAPLVTLTAPTNNTSIIGTPGINISATVATNGNLVTAVEFFDDTTNLIGEAASPPYTCLWTNIDTGIYSVFARAVYNGANTQDSAAAIVAVINTNANFSFETPALGSGNFQYDPVGGSWAFGGSSGNGSGIVANGSGFSNPNAPLGTQAAFLQGDGSIVEMLYGFTPGNTYTITYSAAQRANQNGGQTWNVVIDNTVIATNAPGGTSYATYTASFVATAGTETLSFIGTDLNGGDNTVFLDNVRLSPAISQVPPLVTLTTPQNNAVYSSANPVYFAASVTPNGNSIVGVRYYSSPSNLIAQVTSPYACAWSTAPAGSSSVFAQLVYNGSSTVDSAAVGITVTNPVPVTQGITFGISGETISISGAGVPNRPYYLNTASNLTPPVVWTLIETNISDLNGNISFTNIVPTNAQQFFLLSAP